MLVISYFRKPINSPLRLSPARVPQNSYITMFLVLILCNDLLEGLTAFYEVDVWVHIKDHRKKRSLLSKNVLSVRKRITELLWHTACSGIINVSLFFSHVVSFILQSRLESCTN